MNDHFHASCIFLLSRKDELMVPMFFPVIINVSAMSEAIASFR